jgi:hypothetical protein
MDPNQLSFKKAKGGMVGYESVLFDDSERLTDKWFANGVKMKIDNTKIEIDLFYCGYNYELKGEGIDNAYYHTKIYCDKEKCGEFSFSMYSNKCGCMIMGIEAEVECEVIGSFEWKKLKKQ